MASLVDMAPPEPLSAEEWRFIQKFRELKATYANFTLRIHAQGSQKRQVYDMDWTPRVRLSVNESLSVAVDD